MINEFCDYHVNDYQKEQMAAWQQLAQALERMSDEEKEVIQRDIQTYLSFRKELDNFLEHNFNNHCTSSCYENSRSACCSKNGILTFWADLVVNAFAGHPQEITRMLAILQAPSFADKCIYLTHQGCCWRVRPLVCSMFLCDTAQQAVFSQNPDAERQWEQLRRQAQTFRWPDRPVLFDRLEARFIALGCRSALMYLHTSPGLLRVKQRAGLSRGK